MGLSAGDVVCVLEVLRGGGGSSVRVRHTVGVRDTQFDSVMAPAERAAADHTDLPVFILTLLPGLGLAADGVQRPV